MRSPNELREAIRKNGNPIARIADTAGVARTTLYSFVSGETKSLRAEAHAAVAAVVGAKSKSKGVREDAATFTPAPALADEARQLGLDPNAIAAKAVEDAVKRKRIDAWIEENREAMEANARDIRENGLWSDGLRLF